MFGNVIVHLPTEAPATPVIDCAVSLASALDARLEGVCCAYEDITAAAAIAASAAFVESMQSAAEADAAKRLAEFQAKAQQAGVTHSARTVTGTPAVANADLAAIARLADLNIVAQTDPDESRRRPSLAEAILFESGRPLLMVPYIFSGALKFERMLICWDGSRAAARAVHDALPLLRRAKQIDAVAINEADENGPAALTALTAALSRHQLAVRANRFRCEPNVIHSAILSLAADSGADLLVMGGYGHSRLREMLLGGVTRGMFKSLTVPALMSH